KTFIENPMVSVWLRDAFKVFDGWAENGENSGDFTTLDRIRAEFDAAAPAFSRLVRSGQRAAQESKRLVQQLAETQSKLSVAEADAAARAEEAKRLNDEITAERAARGEEAQRREAEIGGVREQLASKELALAQLGA